MITINLLPVELRPFKRTPVPYILCVLLLLGALFSCAQIYLQDIAELNEIQTTLKQNEDELKSLQPSVNKYNELAEEKKLLATQLTTIDEIASDRIIWSRQLHNLSRLSTENMWFDNINVKTIMTTVSEKVYNPTTEKTTTKKRKIPSTKLVIKGYVSAGVDGRYSISPFLSNIELDEEFSSKFVLAQPKINDTSFGDTVVREFLLEYEIAKGDKE